MSTATTDATTPAKTASAVKVTGNDTAQQFDKVAQTIRGAIIASLPCAFEQFVTISMPGQIIDTRPGKAYVPSAKPSSGELHKIRVNEARLVDSMIPLDTMMLGPTGKSVSRSYLAALDYLVPSETELTLSLINKDQDDKPPTKYGAAMRYLRKPLPGMPTKTPVDIYVEKQALFTAAQAKWDAIQDKNAAEMETNPDDMTAEEMEKRTSRMRMARYELQARWMDWVVNGDKILVDHNFAVVDISTVMARIEASKEAVRASNILDLVDGTQWAQVRLEPQHWATLCKEKAEAWVENNPVSPAVLQREIDRLNLLLAAYEGFKDWNDTKTNPEEKGEPAETPETAQYSKDTYLNVYIAEGELKKAKEETPDNATAISAAEEKYKNAVITLDAMIKAGTAQGDVKMKALKLSSGRGINNSIQARLRSIKSQISILEDRLKESSESVGRDISAHLAVNKKGEEYTLVDATEAQSEENKNLLNGSSTRSNKKPDPWTTISFEHEAKSDSTSTEAKSMSAKVNMKYGGFFGGASVSSAYSKSSQSFHHEMASSKIKGTFSAMMVRISRPWLHSELFHDYEIDTPQTTKLSPGAVQIQAMLAARNDEALAEYGLFPTYPTAFIVAANTEIEIACGEAHADEFMKASASDTNMSVRYGPWGAKASANLKTENSSANSRMEATATGMKLSFQAPQIIGWVSEILPQLPRAKKTPEGGLTGGPIALFRNSD